MTTCDALLQSSPDGRFAIRVDAFEDRGFVEWTTWLVDRTAARDLLRLGAGIEAGFRTDGLLQVGPPWCPRGVLIDPARACFRLDDDQPWLALDAWAVAERAYLQGFRTGLDSLSTNPAFAFPWTEASVAITALAAVALLAWVPWLGPVPRYTFIVIGVLVAVLYIFLSVNGWITWRRLRKLRSTCP